MGSMDNPWCCPHGRPTLRHLLDLRRLARPDRFPAELVAQRVAGRRPPGTDSSDPPSLASLAADCVLDEG
jgi:hypothetical protein